METLQQKINRTRPAVESAGEKVVKLQQNLEQQSDRLESNKERLSNLKKEDASLRLKLKNENSKLNTLVTNIALSQSMVNARLAAWTIGGKKPPRPAALKEEETKLADLTQQKAASEKLVKDLQTDLDATTGKITDLTEDNKKTEKQIKDTRSELASAESVFKSLETPFRLLIEEQQRNLSLALGSLPTAQLPIAFLPVRIQTRYNLEGTQPELLIRIFPDSIHVDTHEPELIPDEISWGKHFWEDMWRVGLQQDDISDAYRQNIWVQIAQRFGAKRAAWVIRAIAPLNPNDQPTNPVVEGQPLPKAIQFPTLSPKDTAWTKAPECLVLPDRWVAMGYRGGKRVLLEWSKPIAPKLAIGPNPKASYPTSPLKPGELSIDDGIKWVFDFNRAEADGMAIRSPLATRDESFDKLLVFGVKNSADELTSANALEKLLEAHHYTGGLAFVPQGTPSNNTEEVPSGYSTLDAEFGSSFRTEYGKLLFSPQNACNGQNLGEALGIPSTVFSHVQHAELTEREDARCMNTALWATTWGYFLEQMVNNNTLTLEIIQNVRRHFIDFVLGRGLLPAFRVGKQPYGVLPVSAFSLWDHRSCPDLDPKLATLLQRSKLNQPLSLSIQKVWKSAIKQIPQAKKETENGPANLEEILRMIAVSDDYEARSLIDPQVLEKPQIPFNLSNLFHIKNRTFQAKNLIKKLGLSGFQRLESATYAQSTLALSPSVSKPVLGSKTLNPNYIQWLNTAKYQDIQAEKGLTFSAEKPKDLLYRMLRHAALLSYSNGAFKILLKEGKVTWQDRLEPVEVDPEENAAKSKTLGRFVLEKLDKLDARPFIEYIHELSLAKHPAAAELDEFHQSLTHLQKLSPQQLELLFRECLDLCSHRLDAWLSSFASKRLMQLRQKKAQGIFLGGFGWVENLRPAEPPEKTANSPEGMGEPSVFVDKNTGGYIHTPSLDQATTAAVLRSGFLSKKQAGNNSPFAIDLSSSRVRLAMQLLDGVRQGQSLSALLGYRFERGLHEQGLGHYIESFRLIAPLGPLYEAEVAVADAAQEVEKLKITKSPEVKKAEAAKKVLDDNMVELDQLHTKYNPNKPLSTNFPDLFNYQTTNSFLLSKLAVIETALHLAKIKTSPEREQLLSQLKSLQLKLQKEKDRINNLITAFEKNYNESLQFSYSGALGKKIVVNPSGSGVLQKVDIPAIDTLTLASFTKVLNLFSQKLTEYKSKLKPLVIKGIKEMELYLGDARKDNPGLSQAIDKLNKAKENHKNVLQSYRDRYLMPPSSNLEALESLPAQNVVDGLALLRLWRDKRSDIPFGKTIATSKVNLPGSGYEYNGLIAELNRLADAVDAVGDAMTAENMYHLVKGDPLAIGNSLNALTEGELPPQELQFVKTPSSGTSLTHRLVVLLNGTAVSSNWATTPQQARSKAEPVLNAWVGQLLGSPEKIYCRADYLDPDHRTILASREISISEIKISPLDLLYLSKRDTAAQESELEQRLVFHLLRNRPDTIPDQVIIQLHFDRSSHWTIDKISIAEILETASAIKDLITKARPMHMQDLSTPDNLVNPGLVIEDLKQRAETSILQFYNAINDLAALLDAGQILNPEALRTALFAMANFGIPGAIPIAQHRDRPQDIKALVAQGQAVLRECLSRRKALETLDNAAIPQEVDQRKNSYITLIKTIFGDDFQVLPRFEADQQSDVDLLFGQSDVLQGGNTQAVHTWFQRLTKVRDSFRRLDDVLLYTQALSQRFKQPFKVGQLPYIAGDRWVGLPLVPGEAIPNGRVSLVGLMSQDFQPKASMVGLMIDEWSETVPRKEQMTGLTFNYNQSGVHPPQCVLLAVPPDLREKWDFELLEATLLETLDLVKLRTVDLPALKSVEKYVDQFLPALFVSYNSKGDTISTQF